ncbi:MAG: hypothetical protein RIT43_526 [Bacteroidota bacterium]
MYVGMLFGTVLKTLKFKTMKSFVKILLVLFVLSFGLDAMAAVLQDPVKKTETKQIKVNSKKNMKKRVQKSEPLKKG